MIDQHFVFLSAFFSIISIATYALATLRGQTKPNRVTWFLWALAPFIAFGGSIQEGVGWPAVLTFMTGLGPLIIFGCSFVNPQAYWRISRLDIVCGVVSVAALALWLITGSGVVAIIFSILADVVAGIPTFIKAYVAPETENAGGYFYGALSAAVTLLVIDRWDFASYGFPAYILMICLGLAGLVGLPRVRVRFDH